MALVRTQLQITAEENGFEVITYCVMPDHLHVLPQGARDDADFQEFMRLFKQRSSFHWKQRFGSKLWQRNYIERVLRDEEDTFTVARYILENTVRAGLVQCAEDYPFSGSFVMDVRDLLDSVRRT